MTGASKFLHPFQAPPWYSPPSPLAWSYNRSETLSPASGDYDQFDYLLTGSPLPHARSFEVIKVVEGFKQYAVGLPRGLESPVSVRREESVWVMRRRT